MPIIRILDHARLWLFTDVCGLDNGVGSHMRRATAHGAHVHDGPAQLTARYPGVGADAVALGRRQLHRGYRLLIILEAVDDVRIGASIFVVAGVVVHLLRRQLCDALEATLALLQIVDRLLRHVSVDDVTKRALVRVQRRVDALGLH